MLRPNNIVSVTCFAAIAVAITVLYRQQALTRQMVQELAATQAAMEDLISSRRDAALAQVRAEIQLVKQDITEIHRLRSESQLLRSHIEELKERTNQLGQSNLQMQSGLLQAQNNPDPSKIRAAIEQLREQLNSHTRQLAESEQAAEQLKAQLNVPPDLTNRVNGRDDVPGDERFRAYFDARSNLLSRKRIVEAIRLRILEEEVDLDLALSKQ